MKLKKKHFKKLKEIAKAVNEIVPGTGVRLDKLISEIESVQKVKVNGGVLEVDTDSDIHRFLDSALVLSNKDPKIGDVGYFWDDFDAIFYSKLYDISLGESDPYSFKDSNNDEHCFTNFSKTPPDLI